MSEPKKAVDTTGAIREESSLTLNEMLKWGGVVFTIVSASVSLVWYVASMRSDLLDAKRELATYKEIATARFSNNETTIMELKYKIDRSEGSLAEVSQKLEVTISILNRIDKKVGNP